MRFRLTLEVTDRKQNTLPLNYQYELSAWIYRVINYGNAEFADWLHHHGHTNDKKQFRLFTFSNLIIPEIFIDKDRLIIKSGKIELIISMLPNETIQHFISGLFQNQEFRLGDTQSQVPLRVTSVEAMMEHPFSNSMSFHSLSPIVVSLKNEDDRYARYLSPDDPEYGKLLVRNLKEKWKAYSGKEFNFDENLAVFKVLSPVRKKGILIKTGTPQQTKIIGYQFDFHVEAPAELIRIGYFTGFGEKNSMGFGCGEIT